MGGGDYFYIIGLSLYEVFNKVILIRICIKWNIGLVHIVRLYRGQNPFYILPRGKIHILLRTVWEETRGAQQPKSPPKQSSEKFGFCFKVKYKLNSTRPLGRVTVQGAYNEPLLGKVYVTWILSPVQSQLSYMDYMVFLWPKWDCLFWNLGPRAGPYSAQLQLPCIRLNFRTGWS